MKKIALLISIITLSVNLHAVKLKCDSLGYLDGQRYSLEEIYYISRYKVITYGVNGERWNGYDVKNDSRIISFEMDCTKVIITKKLNNTYKIKTRGCGVILDGTCKIISNQ